MKKAKLFTILLLLALLASCGRTVYEPVEQVEARETEINLGYIETPIMPEPSPEPEPEPEIPAEIPSYDIFTSGRPRSEYLYDLDFLYATLLENFPFFGVIYRSLGVDMHERFAEMRRYVETVDDFRTDTVFSNALNRHFIRPARYYGHLSILHRDSVRGHAQSFSSSTQFAPFLDELNNPSTRALHRLTDADFTPPREGADSFVFATTSDNIQTEIIEEGRIAYVNILSMMGATMELDRVTLINFFNQVADYDHLIIDIRQNSGGHSEFFPNLVMAPNISQTLHVYNYFFIMDGAHNRQMLMNWFGPLEDSEFNPADDTLLARMPYLSEDDLKMLDFYRATTRVIEPSHGDGIFGGKIWLLVSQMNFSASELAAAAVKQTGFATLVGRTTGGDGIGIQPIVLALPNTGIVVRYSSIYGTCPLGRSNQEFGTTPHIFNRPGLDALQTVLEIIEE